MSRRPQHPPTVWVAAVASLSMGMALWLAVGSAGASGLAAGVGAAAVVTLAAALLHGALTQRLAREHRETAPVLVRAHTAYLRSPAPADPDRPGRPKPRAPGRCG